MVAVLPRRRQHARRRRLLQLWPSREEPTAASSLRRRLFFPASSPRFVVALLPLLLLLLLDAAPTYVAADGEGFDPLIRLPRGGDGDGDGDGGVRVWPPSVFSVDRFGAVGDGLHNDTEAFLLAWRTACSMPAAAVLKVPAKKTYLVGPIDFPGPCASNLTLSILGTIIAPNDPHVWHNLNPQKWLYFHGIHYLNVRGGGTINGMGERWWAQSCKVNKTNPCHHAPTAITFHRCKDLRIHNLMLVNSQQMHIVIRDSIRVKASGLKVIAPVYSPNTDGIHISSSVYVEIKNSDIKTGDDCISIVSNSSKIRIRNIVCGPGHGISIGSLGKFNSSSSVSYVHVDNVIFSNSENGFRIKTWQGGTGFAHKMFFRNAVMINVLHPIIIDQYYCDSLLPCPNQTSAVKVDQISFEGIRGTSGTRNAVTITCSDTLPCEKIFLKDIQLSSTSGGHAAAYCWKAYGSSYGFVDPPSCLGDHRGFSNKCEFQSSRTPRSISKWIGDEELGLGERRSCALLWKRQTVLLCAPRRGTEVDGGGLKPQAGSGSRRRRTALLCAPRRGTEADGGRKPRAAAVGRRCFVALIVVQPSRQPFRFKIGYE